MGREEKTVCIEGKALLAGQNKAVPSQPRRFFAMADTDTIELAHDEYGTAIRQYFQGLFPQRQSRVFLDTVGKPLPIHVAVLFPTEEEPFYLLHTIGMSAAPIRHMPEPDVPGQGELYGELCMMLPGTWPFGPDKDSLSLEDSAAWPIRLLMELGRFPHVHQLWMSYGFMLPNTENCDPFSPTTRLSGVVIVQFEGSLGEAAMADGTMVQLFLPVLVYKEEMELYDEIGPDELIERILQYNNDSFLLNIHRPNAGLTGNPGG